MCSRTPVAVVARDLAAEVQAAAIRMVVELAWANNCTIAIVGRTSRADGALLLCSDGCCLLRSGATTVIPDVDVIQLGGAPEGSIRLERTDGRTAALVLGTSR
ncbi:hypothetical protein [Modestobacter sp. SSW1-42]|uniref:hypothetical protein n=1 Tax=Modestobacter sp. SSW1-42 TaxID=596372 RepID=UPI00398854C3